MKDLLISPDIALPIDAVTQTFAFLAKRGWGKTYAASRLAEEMLGRKAQIVAVDPVGVWWGLRLRPDGERSAFNIPVFGGLHGDLPLLPETGKLVAGLIVEKGISAVLDVSSMRKGERVRFLTDFAEELFHRKKAVRTPVHLFLEEAQTYVPQRVMHDETRMLGAFEDIVKLGRNFGIGVTLISQRPQAVNKECLNLTEALVVGRMSGPQERKTILGWIVEHDLDVAKVVDELPSLATGVGWLWSGSWLGVTKKIRIAPKITFDSSKTPEVGAKPAAPRELAPVDLEEIRNAMAAVVEKVKADDPKELKRRIAELERQIREKSPAAPAKTERIEVPVLTKERVEDLGHCIKVIQKVEEEINKEVDRLDLVARDIIAVVTRATRQPPPSVRARHSVATPARLGVAVVAPARPRTPMPADAQWDLSNDLAPVHHRILDGLAELERLGVREPDRVQVALMCGYTNVASKSFSNAMSFLSARRLIHYPSTGTVQLTEEGRPRASAAQAPGSPAEVQERFLCLLQPVHGRILRPLIDCYPRSMARTEVAAAAGYTNTASKSFSNAMSRLSSLGLVRYPGTGEVAATGLLFLENGR